jgi:hypothetical protein
VSNANFRVRFGMVIISHLADARSRRKARERLARVRELAPGRRAQHLSERRELQATLSRYWEPAFLLFEDVILEGRDIGRRIQKVTPKRVPVAVRHAHQSLFGRALLAASEILTLLRTGHGFGAYARWRTLFEVSVVGEFIKANGTQTAERYREHYPIEARRYLLARWPTIEREPSSCPPETVALFQKLTEEREKLKQKYGAEFLGDLGWAAHSFSKQKITIQDLVGTLNLGLVRAEYKYASYYVHAGGRGSLDHHRFTPKGAILLSEPTEDLIARPGRLSCISLSLSASTLAQVCAAPKIDERIWAIGELAEEAGDAFRQGHRKWVDETGHHELAWRE